MRKTWLALLLAVSVTPAYAAEQTFNLKISHWVPASHAHSVHLSPLGRGKASDIAQPNLVTLSSRQLWDRI